MLAFAEHALTHAARLWEHAPADHKRRLQAVYFPDGIEWGEPGRILTAATASAFKELRALAGSKSRLASTGFWRGTTYGGRLGMPGSLAGLRAPIV
jgi:hypothetical protein